MVQGTRGNAAVCQSQWGGTYARSAFRRCQARNPFLLRAQVGDECRGRCVSLSISLVLEPGALSVSAGDA